MIAALGLLVGIVLGVILQPDVPLWMQPYLPIAVVAALDAVFGAARALLDGVFDDRVFVISFLSNVVVAALLVFLGDQLGVSAQISHRAWWWCWRCASSPTSPPSDAACSRPEAA